MFVYGLYKDSILVYIGQTRSNPAKRLSKHFSDAKLGKNDCMLIIRAIRKYGRDSFTLKILKDCSTIDEMHVVEYELINLYSPRYNIARGGQKGLGHSESTRKKISEIQKKPILCVTDNICFKSVIDAEDFYKAGRGTIGRVASGQRKAYRGMKFLFITDSIDIGSNLEVAYR